MSDVDELRAENSKMKLFLIIIASAALLLRWGHLLWVCNSDLVRLPVIDAAFYHTWAVGISSGDLIGDHIFFMSPLYPYLMGLIYAVLGSAPWKVMAVQGLAGIGTVLLLYRWSTLISNRRVGLTAAVFAAVYGPFIFYDATLLTSSLIIFLSAVILNLCESARINHKATVLWAIGIAIGLSALTRPLVLLFLPFFFAVLFLNDRTTWFKRSIIVSAGVAILLFPVGVRNLVVGGEFTLTTSSAGMNFYVGNNPEATGLYWEAPFLTSVEPEFEDEDYRMEASLRVQKELTTGEAGSFWLRESLNWIVNNPVDYLVLLGRKVYYFLNRAEFANNVSIHLAKAESPLMRYNPIGFWIIAPLGFAGLILMIRRFGWTRLSIASTWILAYFIGGLLFFVSSEYRLPILLPLLVGAAYLVVEIVEQVRKRDADKVLRLVAMGLIFLPLVNFRTDFIRGGENARMDWFNIGNTLMKLNRHDEAIVRFKNSLEIDPYFAEGLQKLAEAYYRSGDLDKAVEIGKRFDLDSQTMLGIIRGSAHLEGYALLNEGKYRAAMEEFIAAGWTVEAAEAETTRISLLNQAQKAYLTGNREESLDLFREVYAMDTAITPSLAYNIAHIQWELGRSDSAEFYVETALEVDSMNFPSMQLLARIYNAAGRYDEADELMHKMSPDYSLISDELLQVREKMDSLFNAGRYEESLETYAVYGRKTYNIVPEDKLRIGRLQYEVGNYDVSLELLRESEIAGIDDIDVFLYQGKVLIALHQDEEAIAVLRKVALDHPDNIEVRVILAEYYLSQGEPKQAWSELEAVSHLEIINTDLAVRFNRLREKLKQM